MGWDVPWYTITDSFDADFGVDEWHGTNAFLRDGHSIFRTYFIDNRGDEAMGSTWAYLDITALGRQEEWEDSPRRVSANAAVLMVAPARRVSGRWSLTGTLASGSGSSARRLRRPERASDQNVEHQHGQRRQQRHPRQLNRKRCGRQTHSGKPHGAKHCR
jgi:hypothetical protein